MHDVWFNYDELRLYVTTYIIGCEVQVNKMIEVSTERYKDQVGNTGRPMGIGTINPIIL